MLSSQAQSDLANAGQFRHIVLPKFSADTVKANAAYLQNLHLRLMLFEFDSVFVYVLPSTCL